ncbi:MAG: ribbon-helix-helix protein, CopG family [Halomonas sp.]|uniref:ribbon-helix-helix protein, CopG family n=1 Tax=Halomonas sp. TaxID=1486246 RepID=UPI002ACE0628|nr:ribbon-helix-helix protein, CopG family [Halomonas sp.]MDZ7851077.1 ribbon-helix-helix protein, CopG family [Halomonas sp.]
MSTLSIRFPDDLEQRLDEEARRVHKGRSELVREAVQDYVSRREKEHFIQDMVDEMRECQGDATSPHESRELSDALPDDDLDTLIRTEGDAGVDPDQRWWR